LDLARILLKIKPEKGIFGLVKAGSKVTITSAYHSLGRHPRPNPFG